MIGTLWFTKIIGIKPGPKALEILSNSVLVLKLLEFADAQSSNSCNP